MSSSDASPTPKESESSAPKNPVEDIPNPQNSNQEITNPQNSDEEITNPQNPDEEITNPQNPDQKITNPQNPDEEIVNPEASLLLLLTPQEFVVHEKQQRQQQEVEAALRQSHGEKGDEWAKEYKMKVAEIQLDAMYSDDLAKDDKKDEKPFSFDDDWEFAEDCILFKGSRTEGDDDIKTLRYFVDYVQEGYHLQQDSDDFELLYGVVSSYGECAGLEVLKKKLAKLLSKFLMLVQRLHPSMNFNQYDSNLHELGRQVWGSCNTGFPLLDRLDIGIRDQENATISDMRASAGSRQGRRFRISQDSTFGRSRIKTAPTSVDEAFNSRPTSNLNRGLVIREARNQADDQPPEAVVDVKGKGKRQAEKEAPNPRSKVQCVEQLLLLFQEAETEEEDDLILLRYASAYGRNVTSPTVAGLYEFILANLPTGEGISWFRLKLKLTMLERRYLSLLEMMNSKANMEGYDAEYNLELYRMGREFWGDEIDAQNPDGNLRTRGASGGASGSGGVNEIADVDGSQGAHAVDNEGALEVGNEAAHRVGNEGDN